MNGLKFAAMAAVVCGSALGGQDASAQNYYRYPTVRPINRYVVPIMPGNGYAVPNCKNGQCNVPVVPNCKNGQCNVPQLPNCKDGKCYRPGYAPTRQYVPHNLPGRPIDESVFSQPQLRRQAVPELESFELDHTDAIHRPASRRIDRSRDQLNSPFYGSHGFDIPTRRILEPKSQRIAPTNRRPISPPNSSPFYQ